MNFRTIVIIIISVLITVIFMQNTDEVIFKFLFKEVYLSKLLVMLGMVIFGFIIGFIVGLPKKKNNKTIASEAVINQNESGLPSTPKNNLSDDDRNYIN